MGARDVIVKYLGEGAARAIERVAAALFGDDQFVDCPVCRTPVPVNLICEWGCCPKCKASSNKLTTEALIARREAALAAGEAANKEVAEIDREVSKRRSKG